MIGSFPTVVDSTLMDSWRSCQRSCHLESFEQWKPKGRSVHLHAGAAYARGLEVARNAFWAGLAYIPKADRSETEPEEQCLMPELIGDQDAAVAMGLGALIEAYGDFECPPDSAKSLERMCGAFEYHFHQYPLVGDTKPPHRFASGKWGIEFQFVEPTRILHPVTGDPILYAGRFDQIVEFAGGLWGFDDKTTSQLGASWPRQWDLRAQFTAYCWGARQAGVNLAGFVVRGISILKTKYETMEAITYRPEFMVNEWEAQLERELTAMVEAWRTGNWHSSWGDACNSYGGCSFRKVCQSKPEQRINWLMTDFERRRWDPIRRVEEVVA